MGLARTQTSAISEHANEMGHLPIWDKVKFIDRDPHWYTRRVKESIHIILHPNNINRDGGIEIPEGWIPTVKTNFPPMTGLSHVFYFAEPFLHVSLTTVSP